jgi:MoaA/NifB/PqqE/SkfB family radical SAM enzyme
VYFWYYSTIDRFAVTKTRWRPPIEDVLSSIHYSGLEYNRYIPLEDLSLDVLNESLADSPREICFEINRRCNLFCPVCIAEANSHSDVCISLSQFEETLKKYKDTVMRITLTGGEALLHTDFLDFVRLASANTEGVVIATNGYQPSILEHALSGVNPLTVAVSLQGGRDVHDHFVGKAGAFDRALNTIRRCLEQGHRVEVLTTAFVEAIESLPILTECLADIRINEHRINLVKARGRIEREVVLWKDITAAIPLALLKYKLTIKHKDQPFLFVASNGEEERRYGSHAK